MCGICGVAYLDSKCGTDYSTLHKMTDAMYHRGPDDEGLYTSDGIALGMRRLSIIDIQGGAQPIRNEDGRIQVVSNGEIYNFRDLRRELLAKGHSFYTQSDTEVIVHLYEELGEDCVQHLRGMFAFALWCEADRKLLLARDRLGIKPLYYWQDDRRLIFASEVRALLNSGLVPWRLSLAGLRSYLAYGAVQEPLTLVEGIYSLPPGHLMIVRDGQARVKRYWDLPAGTRSPNGLDVDEVQEQVRATLTEAVEQRLISDVPLGAFLSGGIDSGAVVGLMSQVTEGPIRTFTISFEEEGFDESRLAGVTAQRCGTQHTEILVPYDQILHDLPQALAAMDQPTVDGINTWFVSRAAKQAGITVALSGLGGDELFAGYGTFREVPLMMRANGILRHIPSTLRQVGGRAIGQFLPNHDRGRKVRAFLSGDSYFDHPYFAHRALFTPQQQRELLRQGFTDEAEGTWLQKVAQDIAHADTYDAIGSVSYLELRNYMLSTLLRDTDCMSMAHSLEVRVPLIDHLLVEQVIGLPEQFKMLKGEGPKPLLVKSLDGLLPPEITQVPKRTFTFPWAIWLKGPLRAEVEQALTGDSEVFDGVLCRKGMVRIWQRFLAREVSWARPWALYVLKRWLERNAIG